MVKDALINLFLGRRMVNTIPEQVFEEIKKEMNITYYYRLRNQQVYFEVTP